MNHSSIPRLARNESPPRSFSRRLLHVRLLRVTKRSRYHNGFTVGVHHGAVCSFWNFLGLNTLFVDLLRHVSFALSLSSLSRLSIFSLLFRSSL